MKTPEELSFRRTSPSEKEETMRRIFVAVALLLTPVTVFAEGPFELEMGMKKSELVASIAREMDPHNYLLTSVPRPHSSFKTYAVSIGPQSGLCTVRAASVQISTDVSGRELRAEFDEIEQQLERGYGRHGLIDRLERGAIWERVSTTG